MYKNLNPRTMGLNSHTFDELLMAAYRTGFKGIEVPAHAFGSIEKAKEEGKRLASLGMRFSLMMAPCDMFRVDDQIFSESLMQWARWLERARAAGCSRAYNHFWPGSDSRSYTENFEWHRNRLSAIWHIMHENGFMYGLEFMGAKSVCDSFRYPFIRSISGLFALTDSVDPKIGFVFDGIHWYTSGKREDDLYFCLTHVNRLVNLHLDDAFAGRGMEEQIDRERDMPNSTGIIDSTRIVNMFNKKGYEGPVIVEPMSPTTDRFEKMKPIEVASECAECLNKIFKEAGVKEY